MAGEKQPLGRDPHALIYQDMGELTYCWQGCTTLQPKGAGVAPEFNRRSQESCYPIIPCRNIICSQATGPDGFKDLHLAT